MMEIKCDGDTDLMLALSLAADCLGQTALATPC